MSVHRPGGSEGGGSEGGGGEGGGGGGVGAAPGGYGGGSLAKQACRGVAQTLSAGCILNGAGLTASLTSSAFDAQKTLEFLISSRQHLVEPPGKLSQPSASPPHVPHDLAQQTLSLDTPQAQNSGALASLASGQTF